MTLQNRHGSEARRADCQTSAQPGRAGRRIAKIVERWRRGTNLHPGAAPPALGRCCGMSQPSRAGLMFGYRPYGPRSDSSSIFRFPHRLGRAGLILAAGPPGLGSCRFSLGSHKKKTPISVAACVADMGVTACSLLAFTKQPLPRRLFLEKSRTSLPFPVQLRSEMLQGGV